MSEPADERQYAWRMIRAARRAHAEEGTDATARSHAEVAGLLTAAMEAGLDRAQVIAELADLGGRLLLRCNPEDAGDAAPDITGDQSINA